MAAGVSRDTAGRPPKPSEGSHGGSAWLSRNLLVLCWVSLLQDAASELIYPLLPLLLTVTLAAPAAVVGIIEGLAEGAAALTKLLAGRAADRQARRRPLVSAGYAMAAVGKVVVAAATVWPVALVGRVVDRVGKGVRERRGTRCSSRVSRSTGAARPSGCIGQPTPWGRSWVRWPGSVSMRSSACAARFGSRWYQRR